MGYKLNADHISFDTIDLSLAISQVLHVQHSILDEDAKPITGPEDERLLKLSHACHDLAKECMSVVSELHVIRSIENALISKK